MSLEDEVMAGFSEAFDLVREGSGSEQGGPLNLSFDGKTVPAVAGPVELDMQMGAAGYRAQSTQSVVLKMVDFDTLNLSDEDEVFLDGRTLRVIKIDREHPFVTIYLAAPN